MKAKIEKTVRAIKGDEVKDFRRATDKVIVLFNDGSSWGIDTNTTDITVLDKEGKDCYIGMQLKSFRQWDEV